jgi:transcriptional regulator with XRE-family HTH domain
MDLRHQFEVLDGARSKNGISRAELCRRADVDSSTYALLLRFKSRVPHRRTVTKLRTALSQLMEQTA